MDDERKDSTFELIDDFKKYLSVMLRKATWDDSKRRQGDRFHFSIELLQETRLAIGNVVCWEQRFSDNREITAVRLNEVREESA